MDDFLPLDETAFSGKVVSAPLGRRLLAFLIDSIIAAFPLLIFSAFLFYPLIAITLYWPLPGIYDRAIFYYTVALITALSFIWFIFYSLCRDGLGGRSLGKRLLGLAVIRLSDRQLAATQDSVLRNLFLFFITLFHWILPVLGLLLFLVEPVFVIRSRSGLRLGDSWAQTCVIRYRDASAQNTEV